MIFGIDKGKLKGYLTETSTDSDLNSLYGRLYEKWELSRSKIGKGHAIELKILNKINKVLSNSVDFRASC